MDEFEQTKIVYPDISQRLSFAISEKGEYLSNTAYFITSSSTGQLEYLLSVLNSTLIDWYYRTISVQLGGSAVRLFSIYLMQIPVPLGKTGIYDDMEVNRLYDLNDDEITFLRSL